MRLIKILFAAILMSSLLAFPAIAANVQFPQDEGHVWIAEDGVFVDRLPNAIYGESYNYTIPLQVQIDGEPVAVDVVDNVRQDSQGRTYTFKLDSSSTLPAGLTMDAQGRISGTVSDTVNKTVRVIVSSSDDDVADAIRPLLIVVDYKAVTMTVTAPSYTWQSGGQYKANFTIDADSLATGVTIDDFTVTYQEIATGKTVSGALDDTYVTNAGQYAVTVRAASSLKAKERSFTVPKTVYMQVNKSNAKISLDKSLYNVQVGTDYTIGSENVTTDPLGLNYTLTFEGIDGTDYPESETPPTAKGTYRVKATVNSANYKSVSATATLKISTYTARFKIGSDDEQNSNWTKTYSPYDSAQYLNVTCLDNDLNLREGVDYRVLYNGKPRVNEYDDTAYPKAVGTYKVTIEMLNPAYEAVYDDVDLTISKRQVTYCLMYNRNRVVLDGSYTPKVSVGSLVKDHYTWWLDDLSTDEEEKLQTVTKLGKYRLIVELDEEASQCYEPVPSTESGCLLEMLSTPELKLAKGNSPAAKDETFGNNGNYTYNGVVYNPTIWGDVNVDADPYAWFCYYEDGMDAEDISFPEPTVYDKTVKGYAHGTLIWDNDKWNGIEWEPHPGIFKLQYYCYYRLPGDVNTTLRYSLQEESWLVLLPQTVSGDVNGDGYVNVGDARYLQNVVLGNDDQTTQDSADKLFLYRLCDVNHDGNVDEDDVAAILNRKNVKLVGYYGYLDDEE